MTKSRKYSRELINKVLADRVASGDLVFDGERYKLTTSKATKDTKPTQSEIGAQHESQHQGFGS